MADFTSELWLMSHSTRKSANMAVMKSANATFHAPPWWAAPWPPFLR